MLVLAFVTRRLPEGRTYHVSDLRARQRHAAKQRDCYVLLLRRVGRDCRARLIPSPTDQNRCAHWRNPMDMMRQG
jgi:hypothetical protein